MLNNAVAVFAAPVPPVTNSYESIATVTVGSGGTSSITFSSIPSTYKHLQIRALTRSSESAPLGGIYMRFNSDSGSNYSWHRVYGNGATTPADGASSTTWMLPGISPTTTNGANIFGATVIDVLDYASTSKNKTVRGISGADFNGSGYIELHSGAWYNSASAVTSISILPFNGSWQQYSSFALYGIKG